MYRDLIGDPERFTAGGREWWVQEFCHADGTLKYVRLFDSDGEFVGDYPSPNEAVRAAEESVSPEGR